VTDQEPNSPDAAPQRLDPTLPLPTEPLAAFGARASAPMPEHAPTPAPAGLYSPPAPAPNPYRPPAPTPSPNPYRLPAPAPSPGSAATPAAHHAPPTAHPAPPARPGALPVPYAAQAQPILVQLGEVAVSSTTIYTPAGEIPLRGSQWTVTDQWHAQHKIPTWAIVCAVLLFFFLCFLSLFFLLAKETRYTGTVQVMITNGQRQYVARIPVSDQRVVQHIHAQVNYVRSLAAL
jgi:hypothetical protein